MRWLDLVAGSSLVGIWPRYIEPRMLFQTHHTIQLPNLDRSLRLAHLTDLHISPQLSARFLQKVLDKVQAFRPDCIVITGDFLCRSRLANPLDLINLLKGLKAPLGTFAILGNHDFTSYVTKGHEGLCDIETNSSSDFKRAWNRFFSHAKEEQVSSRANQLKAHPKLLSILKECGVTLLNNETHLLRWGTQALNLTGLGEKWTGQADPKKAFTHYDTQYPGVILIHNPDLFDRLQEWPGELYLAGHTHGGQIALPFISKRLTGLENPQYRRGKHHFKDKTLLVCRGIGSYPPFRFFSPPELNLITCSPLL